MKTFHCTDGFVEKTLQASTAHEAAEQYAIVTSTVTVIEVDDDGNEIGDKIEIVIGCDT